MQGDQAPQPATCYSASRVLCLHPNKLSAETSTVLWVTLQALARVPSTGQAGLTQLEHQQGKKGPRGQEIPSLGWARVGPCWGGGAIHMTV